MDSIELVNEDTPAPDGGWRAWACVASSFSVMFCVFGFVTSLGELQTYYTHNQLANYSEAEIAWIAAAQAFLTDAGSLFTGRYFDAHGARLLVVTGTTMTVIGLVSIAFCTYYYQFLLAHIMYGIGGSLIYTPGAAAMGHWFDKRRSSAIGIVLCGTGLGGVIYPVMLSRLFAQTSFRNAILIVAGMNTALLLPTWFFLIARLPPKDPPPWRTLRAPWRDMQFTFLVVGVATVMCNLFSPYFNAPLLAKANSVSSTLATYAITILQGSSFIIRISAGFLADRFGVWTMYIIFGYSCAISIFAFWTLNSSGTAVTILGLVSYGGASGSWLTLVSATCVSISPQREFGIRMGMMWSVTAIPILAGPVICGALISADDGRFTWAAVFCGLTFVIGTTLSYAPIIYAKIRTPNEPAMTGPETVTLDLEK